MATDEGRAQASLCPVCGLAAECLGCAGRGIIAYGPGVTEPCPGCGGRLCRCPRADGESPVGAAWAGDVARATTGEGSAGPFAVGVRLSEVRARPIEWLWPGYLALGKLHIIDGDPGQGKSHVTLDLAARGSTGGLWPDGAAGGKPAAAVLMSAEDGLDDTIRPRLDAAGADVDRIVAFTEVRTVDGQRRPPSLPLDVERLGELAGQHDARLVIVDPFMEYLTAAVDSYRDQAVRQALALLRRLAERQRLAIVLVRHFRKGAGSPLQRGGGSIGIAGAARFVYAVGRDPEDPARRAIASVKVNLAIEPVALGFSLVPAPGFPPGFDITRVEWHGPVNLTAQDLVHEEDGEKRAERREAAEWLRAYLADRDGEAPFADVVKAAKSDGFTERTLRRARQLAGVQAAREGFPARSVWRLDEEALPPVRPQSGQSGHACQPSDVGRTGGGVAGLEVGPAVRPQSGQPGGGVAGLDKSPEDQGGPV